jgi:hypothetical protein
VTRNSAALMALAALLATALPAFAEDADGDWACTPLTGFDPVVYVALKGNTYVLTRLDGGQAKGTVAYTDSPIIGFHISGPWESEFDVVEATMLGGDRLIVSSTSGGIGLMCEPGRAGK